MYFLFLEFKIIATPNLEEGGGLEEQTAGYRCSIGQPQTSILEAPLLSWLPHPSFPTHLTGPFCYVGLLWVSTLRAPDASKSRFQLETPRSIVSYLSKLQEMKSELSGLQEQWAWIRWSLFRQMCFSNSPGIYSKFKFVALDIVIWQEKEITCVQIRKKGIKVSLFTRTWIINYMENCT